MLAELDRVTRDTTFNEIAVLDGSFADERFQIGTHEREFAQLSISSMRLDSLGAYKATSQGTETTDDTGSAVDNDNLALNAYAVADTSETNLVQAEVIYNSRYSWKLICYSSCWIKRKRYSYFC